MKKIKILILFIIVFFLVGYKIGQFETVVKYEVAEVTENSVTMCIHDKNYVYDFKN